MFTYSLKFYVPIDLVSPIAESLVTDFFYLNNSFIAAHLIHKYEVQA